MKNIATVIAAVIAAGFVLMVPLFANLSAHAASQPNHRPTSSTIIWFQPSQLIAEATHMIEAGNVEEGMALVRDEMDRDLAIGDRAAASNSLCVGYLMLKDYQAAFEQCSSVIKLKPSLWQGHNNRGNALFGMGDYAGAIPDYENALALAPDSTDVQGNLALAQRYLAEKTPQK